MSQEGSQKAGRISVASSRGAVRFSVRVQPRAARTEVVGARGDALKIRVAAPPVEGAANSELVSFLARRFRVPKSAVQVVRGARGRAKLVEVKGISEDQVHALYW
ncbi:MAG: YggU family protein [Gemmatimonadota bacterium]|nr:MAG: YggU family protein [Gemmatimonadota bacterium]